MISQLTLIAVRILKINVKMFEKQTVYTVSTVNIISYIYSLLPRFCFLSMNL